jgi:putative transposase
MRASRFTDARKALIPKQGAEGMPVAEIRRKAGIGAATCFNRKKRYEGQTPPEMRRLKQLEDEDTKLRKPVADPSLDREMLQDVIRRKTRGLVASASSATRSVVDGVSRSGGHAGCSSSRRRASTIARVDPTGPA